MFKKSNKIDKALARLTKKKKRNKLLISGLKNGISIAEVSK